MLEVLHDRTWELLGFAAVSLAAGFLLYGEATRVVRLVVDDPNCAGSTVAAIAGWLPWVPAPR